jgi:hypothetical protein
LLRKYMLLPEYIRRAYVIVGLNALKLVLFAGVFIPPVSLYSLVLLLVLAIYNTHWAMFSREWRVVLVPFAVSLMFGFFAVAMARAFVRGH